jgi:hypothetical protein
VCEVKQQRGAAEHSRQRGGQARTCTEMSTLLAASHLQACCRVAAA